MDDSAVAQTIKYDASSGQAADKAQWLAERVEAGTDYSSCGIVEYDRSGFSTSPGVHAWVES
ncbi:MAG: hypothetical protein DMF75_18670 [Acidobacteria bacterium]|nr:MAG: hypothetical protein DMF75_18670 [Acidobacteriota bacterium]